MPEMSYEEIRKSFSWEKLCADLLEWNISERFCLKEGKLTVASARMKYFDGGRWYIGSENTGGIH